MITIKKYECIIQDGLKDCGVCSLLTIIKTYGGDVSKEYLRILTNTTKNGTNAQYLFDAAKALGFETKALNGDIKDLDSNMLPCIAHVIIDKSYKHFVVIHKIKNNVITIADPAKGIIKMSYKEFKNITTNNFLIFIPYKKIPKMKEDNKFIHSILHFVFQHKSIFISIFLFSILYTLINIVASYNFQFIIEDAINVSSINNLYFISFLVLFLIVIKYITDYLRNNLFNYINHKLDFVLIKDIFKHIISLPYLYYKNRTTGEIMSRINDLSDVKETLSTLFIYVFVDSILIIFVFISLCAINLTLAGITFLIIIMYLIVIKLFSSSLDKCIVNNQKNVALVNSYLVESIENISTIKNLKVENNIIDNMEDKYSDYLSTSYRFNRIFNIQSFIKNLIDGIGLILIMFIGSVFVLKDKMTVGELITYNSLIIYFLEPLKSIINSNIYIKKAKISIKRIVELYSIKSEEIIIDKKYTNNLINGNISINNLSFSYNGQKKVLDSINIFIKSGDKILISGNSGSGKSTLAKILMKYFDIDKNMVSIHNKDINDYNLLEIRRDICYVSQSEMLFTDSIYNNIVLNRNIDYDEFLNIAELTRVDDIIKNNLLSYDMLLEENGCNISGGERQRIIIARALLKKSNIYILDESLSQLDIEMERNILKDIFNTLKNKTIIVISHRFNNNDLFDKVIKLENGAVYE